MTADVRRFATVPSTMDLAARLAEDGAAHGTVVVADEQTAGRGRRGTAWASPPGAGLYLSFIARPPIGNAPAVSLLTLAAGVGVRDGVMTASGLAAVLKWPNDLLVGRKKLAGILAEGHSLGTNGQAIVIGVGVNVQPAAYPPDVAARATSIEGELGRAIDRDVLLEAILDGLDARLAELERRPGDILQAWRAASPGATGARVEWNGTRGVTAGVDESGALLIKTAAGLERIIAGDVTWNL